MPRILLQYPSFHKGWPETRQWPFRPQGRQDDFHIRKFILLQAGAYRPPAQQANFTSSVISTKVPEVKKWNRGKEVVPGKTNRCKMSDLAVENLELLVVWYHEKLIKNEGVRYFWDRNWKFGLFWKFGGLNALFFLKNSYNSFTIGYKKVRDLYFWGHEKHSSTQYYCAFLFYQELSLIDIGCVII